MIMDPELKAKWLEALRSGNYPQTRYRLRYRKATDYTRPAGYCCLGVLCAIDPRVEEVEEEDSSWFRFGGTGSRVTLPDAYRLAVKIPPLIEDVLVTKNDNGATFEEIAKIIEEEL